MGYCSDLLDPQPPSPFWRSRLNCFVSHKVHLLVTELDIAMVRPLHALDKECVYSRSDYRLHLIASHRADGHVAAAVTMFAARSSTSLSSLFSVASLFLHPFAVATPLQQASNLSATAGFDEIAQYGWRYLTRELRSIELYNIQAQATRVTSNMQYFTSVVFGGRVTLDDAQGHIDESIQLGNSDNKPTVFRLPDMRAGPWKPSLREARDFLPFEFTEKISLADAIALLKLTDEGPWTAFNIVKYRVDPFERKVMEDPQVYYTFWRFRSRQPKQVWHVGCRDRMVRPDPNPKEPPTIFGTSLSNETVGAGDREVSDVQVS